MSARAAAVITCSNRSAAGQRADDSGTLLADALGEWGFSIVAKLVVPDEVAAIRKAVRNVLSDGARLVITTGGTGLNPNDVTPEAVRPMLDREVPGIAEQIRLSSSDRIATSVLSRGVAGTIGDALVVTLPGSPGGVRDGLLVLKPLVHHVLDQLSGGDHRPGGWSVTAAPKLGKVKIAEVLDGALDVAAHEAAVRDRGAGADVTFCGVVRDHDHDRVVRELEYTSYPTVVAVLREVAEEVAADPAVIAVAVSHRIGQLKIGDVALVASVTAAHRKQAFDACQRLVDEVKARLPIWKRQVFDDGTDEWVNCP